MRVSHQRDTRPAQGEAPGNLQELHHSKAAISLRLYVVQLTASLPVRGFKSPFSAAEADCLGDVRGAESGVGLGADSAPLHQPDMLLGGFGAGAPIDGLAVEDATKDP